MSEHTPRPWRRGPAIRGLPVDVRGPDGMLIANFYGPNAGEDAGLAVTCVNAAATPELVEALRACEENLRLIHKAAGPVPKGEPMPKYCTFEAWKMAHDALAALGVKGGG